MSTIRVRNSKSNPNAPINKETGTRFKPGTRGQIAFDCILSSYDADVTEVKKIKAELNSNARNNSGKNVDSGYFSYVICAHPEFFTVNEDHTLQLIKRPQPDKKYIRNIKLKNYRRRRKCLNNMAALNKEYNEMCHTEEELKLPVQVRCSTATPDKPINPKTGTRYRPNTSQQIAFDIVYVAAALGKRRSEIRRRLAAYRKENGKPRNLNSTYFNMVVASHPEFFDCFDDGSVVIKRAPKAEHINVG